MKTMGYLAFSLVYYICRLMKRKNNKIFCIMTHDGSEDSSVGVVVSYLKEKEEEYEFFFLRKEDKKAGLLSFFIKTPYHLATSSYILQDNIFLPFAYIRFPKDVKVVQLWHGTGTIKKFGQSVNRGRLKRLEKSANKTITHLVVNSEYTKKLYQEVFGISEEKVYLLGLPRTDSLFSEKKKEEDLERFYKEFPTLQGKKMILYAPTFRDHEVENPKIRVDISLLLKEIPKEYVLVLKLHPFVASAFRMETLEEGDRGRVYNMSNYRDLNTLLFASDMLITDYSSIIFEYCLLGKPMIFYAYDLDSFSDQGRGFYENYEEYVPGPVVTNTQDMISAIRKEEFDKEIMVEFKNKNYQYLDGRSCQRLYDTLFLKE